MLKNRCWRSSSFSIFKKGDGTMIGDKYAVGNWMNKAPVALNHRTTIRDALQLFKETNKTVLPVVEEGRLIGVLRLGECMDLNNGLTWEDSIKQMIHSIRTTVSRNFRMTELIETPIYVVEEEEKKLIGEIDSAELLHFNKNLFEELEQKKEQLKWFELCFDTAYEGLTVVDADGVIQLFNETYSRFVGVSKGEAIGQMAEHVIDNTRLPIVLKTGIPERSQAHRLQGQDLVVHRIPIWNENKVIGAVGMLVYEGVSEIYQVIERMELLEEGKSIRKDIIQPLHTYEKKVRFEDILGESLVISETKKIARKAARSLATVLITGDSGVGKEQFARAIHDSGITSHGKFVSVNCAAIPDNLLESELFGYAKGAFTGASKNGKAGKFELAHDGTLFLDEIGDMPIAMQAKILRVVQEKRVERVGGTTSIPVNFRLITATNRNLKQMVDKGEFREDLYYRLYVIPIHIPPLRERKQDIPLVIAQKMQHLAEEYEVPEKTIDMQIIRLMYTYDWPGNIRELMNVVERLFVLTEGDHITVQDMPEPLFIERQHNQIKRKDNDALKAAMEKEERDEIETALQQASGNKSQAAKLLGISRATLYNKLSRLSVEV